MSVDSALGSPVTFVVTHGSSSLDLYSEKLAEHLPVPQIHTDAYARVAELFNAPLVSRTALRGARQGVALVRLLRRAGGALHLPNHHFGRYGRFLAVPYVITAHDVIRLLDRDAGSPFIDLPNVHDRAYLRLDAAGIRRAMAIVAVSEATKRDLVRYLGVPEQRITVVYEGVDHSLFRPVERRVFAAPYVLYVGSEQPRKNLRTLLAAFARLKRERRFRDLKLVKLGSPGERGTAFRERTLRAIAELRLQDDVILVGRTTPEDLVAYYSGAECFVLPSLYEGFGLPPLEAMACGCPVVVSDRGALGETAGPGARVVDPTDERVLAGAVAEILTDARAREELRKRGFAHASRFSWERAADETLRMYERIA